jgi:antirestriction protein ArdC
MVTRNTVYALMTDRILRLLEQGTVPWQQPWVGGWPRNLVSGKPYRGLNVFLLGCQSYTAPWWLTFQQCKARGGSIRKGEKATPVVFWKVHEYPTQDADNAEQDTRTGIVLRYYHVFNVEQCEGIEYPVPVHRDILSIAECEQIVMAMPTPPVIEHVRHQAYYSPIHDMINMPPRYLFESAAAYYSTLFHELTHSTGHASRLNRPTLVDLCPFGLTNYSREELVAEMGAAFLCGHTGIANTTIDRSAAYIASWLTRLRSDVTLVVQAASQAQKAVDCILGTPSHRTALE